MGAYLGNNKKLKLMVNNVAFKIYSGKIVNCVHAYSTEVITPTCTTQGYTKHSCSLCGNTYNSDYVAKLAHTIEIIPGKEATTTTPGLTEGQKCKVCGKILKEQTEIPAIHVHTSAYRNENRIEATCMTNGSYDHVEYCTSCFAVLNRTNKTISATGHSWGEWITDVAATETSEGSKHRDCKNCTERETATIPTLDHVCVAGEAKEENRVAATCETTGKYDLVVRCTGCGNIIRSETKTIPATGHTPGAAATCTTAQTCTVCHTMLKAATGHTEVIDKAVAATCTTVGKTEGKRCSVCNKILVAQQTVPALGHTEVINPAVAATCTATGLTEGRHCSVCKQVFSTQQIVPAKGHTEATKTENHVEATCTAVGGYDTITYCSVCNAEIKRTHTEISMVAHTKGTPVEENRIEPTCTANGSYNIVTYCTVCKNKVESTQNIIPSTGHDDSKNSDNRCDICGVVLCTDNDHIPITIPGKAATCTETGLTEGQKCATCDKVLMQQEVIELADHEIVIDPAKAPTCNTQGITEGKHCKQCGETIVAQTILPATGDHEYSSETGKCIVCGTPCDHVSDNGVIEDVVEPTCGKDGKQTVVYKCTICESTLESYTETIPATLKHVGGPTVIENEVAPGCDTYGSYQEVVYCTGCGVELERHDGHTDPTGHEYLGDMNDVPPTCTENGHEESQTCQKCGDVLEGKILYAPGHTSDNGTIENEIDATCDTQGSYDTVWRCTECGDELERSTSYTPILGHTGGETVRENEIEAGCETWGSYEEVVYCTVCGDELNRTTGGVIKPTGHSLKVAEEGYDKTCTTPGKYTSYYCENDGCDYTEGGGVIPEEGHNPGTIVIENEIAPTCEEDGSHDEVQYCTVCNEELSRDTETDYATGHLEGESVTENSYEPSCTKKGSYDTVWYCQYCDTELQRSTTTLELVPHTWGEEVQEITNEAGCETWGEYDTVVYCTVCNGELSRAKDGVLEPLGHEYINGTCVCQREGCGEEVHYGSYWRCTCDWCGKTVHQGNEVPLGYLAPDCINGIDGHEADGTCCDVCYDTIKEPTKIPGEHVLDSETCECKWCHEIYHNMPNDDDCYCTNCEHSYLCDYYSDFSEATCTQGKTCNRCGNVWSSPLGHSWVVATCDKPKTCSVCEATEGEAKTHDWGDWEIWVEGSCDEMDMAGERRRYCMICGAEDLDDNYRPEHSWESGECTVCGTQCDQGHSDCVCSKCGYENHSFVDGVCEYCPEPCTYRDNGAGQCAECGGTPDQHRDACLIASTPILMADGTEKAISEVKAGDMIKSWDLDNNEYIDVKVLGSYRTGDATDWLVYSFDNGKELTIYDQHNIYCKENNSIKKSTYWKPDQTAITLDGNETAYCGVVDSETPEKVSRHTLVTENNLYFANGILCGHHARAKYKFFTKDMLEANLEQAAQFKATYNIYQAMNGTENAEYRKEAAELIENIRAAKRNVKDRNSEFAKDAGKLHKKQTNKKLKEIKQFNSEADTFKVDIKTINKDIRKSRKELNKLKEKYGVSTKTIYECWKEAYDLDMKYLRDKAAE